jgi:hypothetical protein
MKTNPEDVQPLSQDIFISERSDRHSRDYLAAWFGGCIGFIIGFAAAALIFTA